MQTSVNRRKFVATAAAGIATVAAHRAGASSDHHGHHGHKKEVPQRNFPKGWKDLAEETLECYEKGQVCLSHCNHSLAHGDTSLAECQKIVSQTMSVVKALHDVVHWHDANPQRVKELAKICKQFCQDCAEECKKHRKHHKECRECMESCKDCIKACDKIIAA